MLDRTTTILGVGERGAPSSPYYYRDKLVHSFKKLSSQALARSGKSSTKRDKRVRTNINIIHFLDLMKPKNKMMLGTR